MSAEIENKEPSFLSDLKKLLLEFDELRAPNHALPAFVEGRKVACYLSLFNLYHRTRGTKGVFQEARYTNALKNYRTLGTLVFDARQHVDYIRRASGYRPIWSYVLDHLNELVIDVLPVPAWTIDQQLLALRGFEQQSVLNRRIFEILPKKKKSDTQTPEEESTST